MRKFSVFIGGIQWDDQVDGERVDVSGLPQFYRAEVHARTESEAVSAVMDLATEEIGFCIVDISLSVAIIGGK